MKRITKMTVLVTQTKASNLTTTRCIPFDCIHNERRNCFTLISVVSLVVFYVNVTQTASFLSFWTSFDTLFDENKWTNVTNKSQNNAKYSSSTIKSLISIDQIPQTNVSSKERPLCIRQQIRKGKWLPILLKNPPYVSKTMHLRCQISSYDYDSPGPWPSWFWEQDDSSCQITSWDASTFCQLLPYTTVSVMGDSLSWEQYSSLLQLIGTRVHQNDQHASRLEDRNVIYFACRGQNRGTKFVFRNDAQLKAETISNSISNDFPTVLILNRGAHYVNDTELLNDMNDLLPVLRSWQQSCTKMYHRCHLFWRTTVPGHPNCMEYTSPVNNITLMESLVESRTSYTDETIWDYHWQDFKHQNNLVLNVLQQYSASTGLQYEVIDAYEINILRPDRHRWHQNDCLHSCYPGKMDVYNQLLLHYLLASRSTDDVQYMIDRFERFRSNHTASEQNSQ